MAINVRTDLASEARRIAQGDAGEMTALHGVEAHEETLHGFGVTAVEILDDNGAQKLNKPIGKYFSLELPSFMDRGGDNFAGAAEAISELLRRCLPDSIGSAFIAALGNPDITPDALGNLAAAYTLVTRHLKPLPGFESFCSTALCRTGVLGTTGMESAAQIRTLVRELKPDCLIVIDALAGADPSRLCRTVQVCDIFVRDAQLVNHLVNRSDVQLPGALNTKPLRLYLIALHFLNIDHRRAFTAAGTHLLFHKSIS